MFVDTHAALPFPAFGSGGSVRPLGGPSWAVVVALRPTVLPLQLWLELLVIRDKRLQYQSHLSIGGIVQCIHIGSGPGLLASCLKPGKLSGCLTPVVGS